LRSARARLAAILFLRAYGRDPDALAPVEAPLEAAVRGRAADPGFALEDQRISDAPA